jgi:hypothetical protein
VDTDGASNAEIDAVLKSSSHYIDSRVRRKDGFNQSTSVETRTYDIGRHRAPDTAWREGYARVWLPHDVATVTGLIVKVDLNANYDVADSGETLSINTDFWVGPASAAVGTDPRPYEYLDINPNSTKLSSWPLQRRALEITAKFGWPEVPEPVKELTIAIARWMRDLQTTGITIQVQAIDVQVQTSPELSALLKSIERQYAMAAGF